jgi:hypothetical protein
MHREFDFIPFTLESSLGTTQPGLEFSKMGNRAQMSDRLIYESRKSKVFYRTDESGAPPPRPSFLDPAALQPAEASIQYLPAFLAFQPSLILQFLGQSIPVGGPLSGGYSKGIETLWEKVNAEWEKYGFRVGAMPDDLREKLLRVQAEALERAKAAGWSGEQELGADS